MIELAPSSRRTPAETRRLRRLAGRVGLGALLCVAALGPADGLAQLGPMSGHPMPQGPRPLHSLVAEADAAAIGTIDAVDVGRIRVRDATALFGDPPSHFELKRAPSSPPDLEPGRRAVLLLQGARSPYLLVGAPREQISRVGPSAEARLGAALVGLRAVLADPEKLRDLYLAWWEDGDPMLRPLAFAALVSRDDGLAPLPEALALPRARSALDPALDTERRREAAAIASLSASGADALLAGSPVAGDPAGGAVYEVTLASGLLHERRDALEGALARGLASPDAAVRRIALRYARALPSTRLASAIATLATSDPDPEVKREAGEIAGAR